MNMKQRRILITAALPYANGPIHLGHMVEYIQTDIWARFQRAQGHEAYFIWADDTHGTPIMLHAQKRGITPDQLIAEMAEEHQRDFRDFGLSYDHFGSTNSASNRAIVNDIWANLQAKGHVESHTIEQCYDAEKQMFLPDRFIRGNCPKCAAEDQYGDSCEVCGATYDPTDLVNPVSTLSNTAPVLRKSEHFFVRLADFTDILQQWMQSPGLQDEVRNKLQEWFADGLRSWDVSRDAPYFGFEIPGQQDKFFYVWLDAPVGYMASFADFCASHPELDFDAWWRPGSDTELYHFVGKDIIYFHALFWPAVLHGGGYRIPTAVFAHGFLTVNGAKMSKSRGTFIMARTYLNHLHADYLRYYFAARLGNGLGDIDLQLDDFRQRVNADLIGKLINIASRCAGFIHKLNDGVLGPVLPDQQLYQQFLDQQQAIATDFEQRNYQAAVRKVMALADQANQYLAEKAPWQLAKQPDQVPAAIAVCTQGLNLFRLLITWLAPVLPDTATRAFAFLNLHDTQPTRWSGLAEPLLNHRIHAYDPLLQRIEESRIAAIIADSRASLEGSASNNPGNNTETTETTATPVDSMHSSETSTSISIDDFLKVELRVARIVQAEAVAGADKLLRLELDLGDQQRQVFAGIKSAYTPEQLQGRLTVMVANLAPRKMRFGVSEGMVLAAGEPDDGGPFLLSPDSGAQPGQRVR
ncbi:MAG: methionine--tRNA ligase [Wenzhouxiangellaceae bacterium]